MVTKDVSQTKTGREQMATFAEVAGLPANFVEQMRRQAQAEE